MAQGHGASYTPVQLQKLFFLIDKNIGKELGGPFFNFQPYHYGPFDSEVYSSAARLSMFDLVDINQEINSVRTYRLTVKGQEKGEEILSALEPDYREYIARIEDFVRRLGFKELIEAIYRAYPEMKVNSIFR